MIKLLIYIILIFVCNNNLRNLDSSLILDKDNWEYNSEYGTFYQFNIPYCNNPASNSHNILGIYVPRKYFLCTKLSTSKYSCSNNLSGKIGIYTTSTAPIVLPIYGENYLENDDLIYSDKLKECLSAVFIYIYIRFINEYE